MTYSAEVENSTITANTSAAYAGGIYSSYYGALSLAGSIVAGNNGGSGDVYDNSNPASTAVDSIIGNNSGSAFVADGVLIGDAGTPVDAMLSPLADNGGPTMTHAPMPGSPAIDANASSTSAADQRGGERPWDSVANAAGGVADIGSHEYLAPVVVQSGSPDFDGDGDADCDDIDALQAEIVAGTNNLTFDANGDGAVDALDQTQWLSDAATFNGFATPYQQADFNLDRVVDVSDFGIWNAAKFTTNSSFCAGDANADGVVDVSDFGIWNAQKFTAADSAAVAASVDTPDTVGIAQARVANMANKLTYKTEFDAALTKTTNGRTLQFEGLRQNSQDVTSQVNVDFNSVQDQEDSSEDRTRTANVDVIFANFNEL